MRDEGMRKNGHLSPIRVKSGAYGRNDEIIITKKCLGKFFT